MRTFMTTPAVIRRFNKTSDAYGNEVRSSNYTDTDIRCWVSPASVGVDSEDRLNRDQVVFEYTVSVYGNPDIRHHDQLIVDESVYLDSTGSGDNTGFSDTLILEVVGAPMLYRNRQGRVNHVQLTCRRVEG